MFKQTIAKIKKAKRAYRAAARAAARITRARFPRAHRLIFKRANKNPPCVKVRTPRLRYTFVDLRSSHDDPVESAWSLLSASYECNGAFLIQVPLDFCRWRGATGLCYGYDSIHPFVLTLRQYAAGEFSAAHETPLSDYYRIWTPTSLSQTLGLDKQLAHSLLNNAPALHSVLPWYSSESMRKLQRGTYANPEQLKKLEQQPKAYSLSATHGPRGAGGVKHECKYLFHLYQRIAKHGYNPRASDSLPHRDQHIVGEVLVRAHEYRVMVTNGQHRCAVLSALGYASAPILVRSPDCSEPNFIRAGDRTCWPLVKNKLFSVQDAARVFDRVFDGNLPPTCDWYHAGLLWQQRIGR